MLYDEDTYRDEEYEKSVEVQEIEDEINANLQEEIPAISLNASRVN